MQQKSSEKNIGVKIQRFRKQKKLTQQQAADKYGCSLRWWQAMENGRNMSVFVLHKIANVLDVEAWKLLKP